MQKIQLLQAKAGMILGRDVFRGDAPGGFPICGKGAVLTESLLMRFITMGVKTVYVEGNPIWEEGQKSTDDLIRDLDHRFRKSINEPLNTILYDVLKAHLLKSTGGDGSEPEKQ